MAWDIYGNKLTPGYCEVHYWVPEEYPCYLCMRDIERQNEQRELAIAKDNEIREYYEAVEREHQEDCELKVITQTFTMFDKIINRHE